jgi:hypothetical protein
LFCGYFVCVFRDFENLAYLNFILNVIDINIIICKFNQLYIRVLSRETMGVGFGREANKVTIRRRTNPPSPHSVEAPQNEIRNRERSEITGGRPEELQGVYRRGAPAQGLEEWEQRESEVVVVVLASGEITGRFLVCAQPPPNSVFTCKQPN